MNYMLMFFVFFQSLWGHCDLIDHLRNLDDKSIVSSIPSIDYMYLINLDHRTEKYQQSLDEFSPYGIIPYRFSAVNGWKLPIEVIWDVGFVFKEGMRKGGMGTVYRLDGGKEYHSHEIIEEEGVHYLCHCSARGVPGCILSHLLL